MNEQAIQDGYKFFKETGYKGSLEDYVKLMAENPNAVKDTYNYFKKTGYNGSEQDFSVLFGIGEGVKKKDSPQPVPVDSDGSGEMEITEEVLQEQEGVQPISSDYLNEQNLNFEQAEVTPYSPIGSDSQMENLSVGEKSTAIERTFGKNEFTDFFGDMWRAGVQGQLQGGTVDEALEIMGKSRTGMDISSEDIQDFLAAQSRMQNAGVSDEMKDFNRIYTENGGGAWGWVKGVAANPSTLGQLFVSSVSAMLNPTVLAGAAVGGAAGSAVPVLGTALGAFAGAGVTLETGLTFAELLQKEVLERGLKFDEAGVRDVLESDDAMSSIRNRAAARGAVIGAIDGIASKVGIRVGAKTLGKKAYGVGKKLKAIVKVGGIEAVGGSLGEVGGRIAAGQEMDAAEVLFEGAAGTATLPGTIAIAAYKSPKYYINKSKFNESQKDLTRVDPDIMEDLVYNSSDKDFAATEITIKNNPQLKKVAETRRNKIKQKANAQKEILDVNPNIPQETLDKIIPLQEELNRLEGNKSQTAKVRRSQLIEEIKAIEESVVVEESAKIEVTEETIIKSTSETSVSAKEVIGPNTFTHVTPNVKAVLSWVNGGSVLGRGEKIENFNKEQSTGAFNTNKDNTNVPNFQEGGIYEDRKPTSGYIITTNQSKENFSPNRNGVNQANFVDSRGVGILKPTEQARNLNNFDVYKVNKDGSFSKVDISQMSNDTKVKESVDTKATTETKTEAQSLAEEISIDTETKTEVVEETLTETKQDANTKQSTTTIPGQEQTTVTPKVDKRNTKSSRPSRKSESNTKAEKQKTDTQEKTKIKKLNAIAPNAYVNESNSGSRKRSEVFIKPAKRALAALKRLSPKTMVVIHEMDADYQNATGNMKVKSAAVFDSNKNVIHINADLANGRTRILNHEIFHAILKNKLGSESKIAAMSDRMMQALEKADLNPEVKAKIDKYVKAYKKANTGNKARLAFANEEYMAEVFSFLSNNYTTLKAPEQTIIKRFLSKLSNLLGLTAEDIIATDEAIIDLLNVVAGKVQTGEVITKSDVKQLDLFAGGKNVKNPSAALKTIIYGDFEITYTQDEKIADYIKDGRVTQPKTVKEIFEGMGNNVEVSVHSPDDMLAGEVKYKGEPIFEGSGGVFFVTKFKEVWASTEAAANQIVTALNKQIDKQGKAFLMLAKGSDQKLMSSAAGVKGAMKILDLMLDNNIFSASEFRAAVSKAVAKEQVRLTVAYNKLSKAKKAKKPAPKFKPFKLRKSAKDIKKDIVKLFSDKKSGTFEERGNIVKGIADALASAKLTPDQQLRAAEFLGGDTKRKVGVGSTVQAKTGKALQQGLADLVALTLAENLTKGLKTGDIYAVIEVNQKVKAKKSDHPSYDTTIVTEDGKPPILHLPQERQAGSEVLEANFGSKNNSAYSPGQVPTMTGEVNMSEMKTFDVEFKLFDKSDTINDVVAKARGRDYSDAAIYEYLRNNRKLTVDAARAALEQKTGAFVNMPFEFTRVDDNKGQTLFNEISYEIKKWMRNNPNATSIQVAKQSLKILRDNDIFKAQYKTVKAQVELSYASVLKNIKSKVIKKRIARLKRDLYLRKQGEIDLRKVQIQLKQLIEKFLPAEATYSKSEVKNLLNLVAKSNADSILSVGQKVLKTVDQKRKQVKNNIIFDMKKLLNKAIKETGSRPTATNIEAQGKEFFQDAIAVIRAVTLPDTIAEGETASKRSVALSKLANQITANQETTNIALEKQKRNEKLTVAEVRLINRVLAFDTYSNIQNLELEAVKDLFAMLKLEKQASIAMLNASRLERAEINNDIYNQATSEIRENHPELFDDVTKEPLDSEEISQKRLKIFEGPLKEKLLNWWNQYKFTSGIGIASFFRNRMSHLGTLMNLIDNVAKKNTFFYDNVYQAMNRMHTKALKGYYNQQGVLNAIAASIPGIDSFKDWKAKIPYGLREITLSDGKTKNKYNVGQLIRIYALAKNADQRNKLEVNGFGPKQLIEIEKIIEPEAMEFADKIVEYLTTDYFESINDVYVQNNYVNLNPVDNYFPTKSISAANQQELQGGNFSQVFNQENNSATKNRTDLTGKIDTKETFTDTLENHISQMERYKAYAPGVKNLEAIFKVPVVNTLLTELGIKKTIYNSINLALNPQAGMVKRTNLDALMTKFTGFALSFKAVQLLKQSTSFVNAFEEYDGNAGQFLIGMAKVIANLPYYIRLAKSISPDFTDRLRKGLEGDIYRLESGSRIMKPIEKRLTGNDAEGRINRAVTFFKKAAASPTVMGDVMGVMGYMVNYERNLSKGMSQAKAAEAFNNYNATQQSRRDTDKIPIQQSQSPLVRPFTMFGSTLFLQINKVLQAQSNIMKSLKEGGVKNVRRKDIRAAALNYAGANVMFALAANIALLIKGDDEDKEVAMNRMKDAMYGLNLLYQIPLFGSAAEEGINKLTGKKGYSDDVVNPYKAISRKIFKATKEGSIPKSIQPLVEMGLGTQLDPFIGLYNVFGASGKKQDEAVYNVLGISPSYQPALGQSYSKEDLKYIKETNPEFYDQIKGAPKNSNKLQSKSVMRVENPELYYQLYGTY